jgi:hypothetical protein
MQTENVLDFHDGDDDEYENEIVVAKLVTGESIIGEINIDLENYIYLPNPCRSSARAFRGTTRR